MNPIFELKCVQFTGLPFRKQKFAVKIDQNLKKLNKSIKIWQIFQIYDFLTRKFVNSVKFNTHRKIHNLRPNEKINEFPEFFLVFSSLV